MRYTKVLSHSWCRRFPPLFRQLFHVGFGVGMTAGGTEMRWEAWWHASGSGGAPPGTVYLQIWAKYLHVLQRYSSINVKAWLLHCPCADKQWGSDQPYQLCSAACTSTPQEGGCLYPTIASPGSWLHHWLCSSADRSPGQPWGPTAAPLTTAPMVMNVGREGEKASFPFTQSP